MWGEAISSNLCVPSISYNISENCYLASDFCCEVPCWRSPLPVCAFLALSVSFLLSFHPQECGKQLSDKPGSQCFPLDSHLLCHSCHMSRVCATHWSVRGFILKKKAGLMLSFCRAFYSRWNCWYSRHFHWFTFIRLGSVPFATRTACCTSCTISVH